MSEQKGSDRMSKTLYSLLLDEEVVRAVDGLAHRSGMSRSALVNRILAERLELTTPEARIAEVFRAMEALIRPDPELVPFFAPNTQSISMKSALDYKYRPTVKYEVQLFRSAEETIGELSVLFRTQSAELLAAIGSFFRLWAGLEEAFLTPRLGFRLPCALYDGKFVRGIARPMRDCSAEELAAAISAYVRLLDRVMKGYLAGRISAGDAEREYAAFTAAAELLL